MAFYYDFEFTKPISPDDLQNIEKEMRKIIDTKSSITKTLHSKEDALKVFKEKGESIKNLLLKNLIKIDNFQLYYQDDMNLLIYARGLIYQASNI